MTALNRGERWTDYAFLKISRDSEEPRRHEDNHNAIRISLHRTSPTVLASGAAVAAALSTLPLGEADGAAGRGPGDMNSELSRHLADSLVADRQRAAERFRRARARTGRASDPYDAVTVRLARASDAQVVARLAELEGQPPLVDPTLVAEVEGVVVAAHSLHDGTSVADPFRRTAHLTELLALRARHLRRTYRMRPRRRLAAWLRSLTAPR